MEGGKYGFLLILLPALDISSPKAKAKANFFHLCVLSEHILRL